MLSNLGLDREGNERETRICGRRHFSHDDAYNEQPTYMTAPFAVQQEASKRTHPMGMPPTHETMMHGEDDVMHHPVEYSAVPPPLRQDRLSRGGLNIFSWNTDVPSAPHPRPRRDRDAGELLQLRPVDGHVLRDTEVREKFEGNKNSRFLCFTENDTTGRQRGRQESGSEGAFPSAQGLGPMMGGMPDGLNVRNDVVSHGRRRHPSNNVTNEGIAGFAGMGMGGGGRPNRQVKQDFHGF